jgi:UDP-glucose 4-epimerase
MRVLIAGGAGFIGSHLSGYLLARRDIRNVIVYDNLTSGSVRHLDEYRGDARFNFVEADVKHLGELSMAMRRVDVVFHLAANPDIAKAARQPDIDFWEGTYLTQNVLEAMRINGVRTIIYTSGSGVYGENPEVAFAEDYGPCSPISTYGASKLASEALICSYCHMFGLIGRAFRFANVVGPRQTHGVGHDFIRRLKQDPSQLRILGDGSQCKSYIHVEDVLAAMFLVSSKVPDSVLFDVFNVATDDYITVTQIADLAIAELGHEKSSVRYIYTGGDRGWKGDVPRVLFDVTKIKHLGWRSQRDSVEAIRDSLRAMIAELDSESR